MPTSDKAAARLADLVDRCRVTDSGPLGVSLSLALTPADYDATLLPTAHEVMRAYGEKHDVKVNKLTDSTLGL